MIPRIKVLSLGLNQINFIEQLYGSIKKKEPFFSFDIDNFLNFTKGEIKEDKSIYNEFYNYSEVKISFSFKIKYLFKSISKGLFWRQLFLEIHWNGLRSTKRFVKYNVRNNYIAKVVISPKNHQVYHFHSIVIPNVKYLEYLPQKAKIICSFWGLDLLDRWGDKNYYYIRRALNRSTIITVQTSEMKSILLAKFGQDLKEKVRVVIFPLNKRIFNNIDKLLDNIEIQKSFKNEIGILDTTKLVISLGYHAGKITNHINILNELEKLPKNIKSRIVCILPLTYQRNEVYLAELDDVISKISDFQIVKIDSYLSFEQVALLRIISDIAINAPEKDALSSVVLEVVYANNITVYGEWLPYQMYKKDGLNLIGFNCFSELSMKIKTTIENYNSIIKDTKSRNVIKTNYLSDSIVDQWIDIYKELI